MVNIKDLKDALTNLKKECGYIFNEYDEEIGCPKILSKKDEAILKIFEYVINYLEEEKLKESGFYD